MICTYIVSIWANILFVLHFFVESLMLENSKIYTRVRMKSFPRFWRNHPYCRNKWYLIWTGCLFSLRWSKIFIFFEKKNKNWQIKKHFPAPPILNIFMKISWIGPWVSRIDWCEGHWCGSTYMVMRLSDISSKTGKKCILIFFASS